MITITKNKIYKSPYSLKKTEQNSKTVKEIELSEIINYIGDNVELGEDLTFGNLFDLIIYNKEFLNVIFNFEMDGLIIDDFISDYEKKFIDKKDEEYILKLSWICDIYDFNNRIEYFDYVSFEAYGKISKIDKENYPIIISFTPLCELKNKILTIDNAFEIQNSNIQHNDLEAILKANYRPIKLYDLIGSILSEISFYGNPEDRDKHKKDLEKESLQIEKWMEEENSDREIESWDMESEPDFIPIESLEDFEDDSVITFWDKLYPRKKEKPKKEIQGKLIVFSEISDKSLEEQLQEAHNIEDYERAAKIKKLIDRRNEQKK